MIHSPTRVGFVSNNKNELKTRVSRGVLNGRFYASFAKNTSRIRAFFAVRVFWTGRRRLPPSGLVDMLDEFVHP